MSKGKKKKLAAAIAALAVAAGFLSGGAAVQDPSDIGISEPAGIVMEAELSQSPLTEESGLHKPVQKKFKKRGAFWTVPASILGSILSRAVSLLWKGLLSPVLSTVLGWVLTALVILVCVAIGLKAAFPGTPLKEILNKKNVKRILVLAFFACGFFDLLKLGWPELERFENAARAVICVGLSCYAVYRICRKHARKAERI